MSAGKNIPHDSGLGHVTGKSLFIDDRPLLAGEIFVGVVGSPVTCGELLSVDFSRLKNRAEFVGAWTAADLKHNAWGTIVQDQPLLAGKKISYFAEPVALIAVTSPQFLAEALALVQVRVKESEPTLTLAAARAKKDILYTSTPIERGDLTAGFKQASQELSGVFRIGGQEHFYLESQAAIAYPLEGGGLEVHTSNQHPSETQAVVAHALGLSLSQVTCVVQRMGGGFGGKESQAAPIAAYAALVALKTQRPARLIFTKDQDMMVTGKRHPFEIEYRVGFDSQGQLLALQVQHFADAGAYLDLSPSILDRALFHTDGCYYIPNIKIEGSLLRTNHHSNTAFRGFGGPQGNFLIEKLLQDIARTLGKDPLEIRERNLYSAAPQNRTPYGQEVEETTLRRIFSQLKTESQYSQRRAEIDQFNSLASTKRHGKLRGLGVAGVKFGIAFTARFLNQANALVIVHRDGSVQVATGATEMGQGVNTKIQQLVALEFGIPVSQVLMLTTRTDRNANTSPTAASSGTDLNGAAAVKAARALKRRLAWVAENLRQQWQASSILDELTLPPEDFSSEAYQFSEQKIEHSTGWSLSFQDVIFQAYQQRLSLSEYAHFRTEGLGYDKLKGQGIPFKYFTQGAAVSEVEVDRFTGEVKVKRVDILMDIGRSINPGIDRGQITGAFVQGQGWVTSENLVYNDKGALLSHSPTTYKIPNIQDVPRQFNVKFLDHPGEPDVVFRSKAVGEPPFLLATSIWTGIVDAISSLNSTHAIELAVPATNEAIVMELARHEK